MQDWSHIFPVDMSIRMKTAFWCYLLVLLSLGIFGIIYLSRSQFMPYHAIAVGKTWAEVDPSFQILLLALIRAIGGTWIATALAIGLLLFIPFKQGARWAIPCYRSGSKVNSTFCNTYSYSEHTSHATLERRSI